MMKSKDGAPGQDVVDILTSDHREMVELPGRISTHPITVSAGTSRTLRSRK